MKAKKLHYNNQIRTSSNKVKTAEKIIKDTAGKTKVAGVWHWPRNLI